MSESIKAETPEEVAQQTTPLLSPEFETVGLNPTNISPLLIDNKQVYFEGFKSLSDEDKSRVLLGFLIRNNLAPDHNNLEPETTENTKAKHELWKDRELFSIKKYGTIIFLGLAVLGIVAFLALFVYITLKQGVLDENGILSGLLTSVQEVLRILFTSPGDI